MICVKKDLITVLINADEAVAVVIVDTLVRRLSFPSDSIPSQISKEQYLHVLSLLRKTQCKSIITYYHSVLGNNTMVVFYRWVFTSHGYIFLPDNTGSTGLGL